ncbi:ArnT family glycosyltransferase [candidate division CSSED10-310 bacterium]|uniref:ArnT family glycosyltransferase n=1 Tax=candidate division CSSED10-310 bacterium TaxID=2855610 RepID=A0ABV6Z5B6_UNCC1
MTFKQLLGQFLDLDERTFVVSLFIFALCSRFLFMFLFWGINSPPVDDGIDYHRLAHNLVETGSFSGKTGITARRPPLYPYFISWWYYFFGPRTNVIRIIQAIMNSGLVLLIFLVAKILYGRAVAVLAGILAAFYPVFIFLPSRFLTENLFTLILLLGLWYLLHHWEGGIIHYGIGGALLGLAILCRPVLLLAPPFILWWLYSLSPGIWPMMKRFVILMTGMIIIILPWSIRNYLVFETFVPVTTNAGLTFLHDNNPYLKDMGWAGPQNRIFRPELINPDFTLKNTHWRSLNEAQQDKMFFRHTWHWIGQNPLEFIKLLPRKMISFLNYRQGSNTREVQSTLMDLVGFLSFGLLLPFMAIGFGWTLKFEHPRQRLLHAIIITFFCSVLIYSGSVRLRVPVEPYLLIFASYTIIRWQRIQRQ